MLVTEASLEADPKDINCFGVITILQGVDEALAPVGVTPINKQLRGLRIPFAIQDVDSGNSYDLRDLLKAGDEQLQGVLSHTLMKGSNFPQ